MRTVGVIGGLGPETTAEFYLELIQGCQAAGIAAHPHILIESVALPLDVESDAITQGSGEERCLPYIIDSAKRLEQAGADFLVMPCNSLHAFIAELRSAVRIPVLSIVEEAAMFLHQKHVTKVGVVATALALNRKLYQPVLAQSHIEQVVPNDLDQAKLGQIIHNLVSGRHTNSDRQKLIEIIDRFENEDVGHVLLACTDLQLLIPSHPNLKIYDTMKIFADASVREINAPA